MSLLFVLSHLQPSLSYLPPPHTHADHWHKVRSQGKMATATPLSLPFVLRQDQKGSISHSHRRRFKPDRPNYRALLNTHHSTTASEGPSTSTSSRLIINATKQLAAQLDADQLEAELQEWGLPSADASSSSSSAVSRLAAPTSAISWDENSILSSCSYLQGKSLASSSKTVSLDQWDPSISFAPFASSGLNPVELSTTTDVAQQQPFKYDPGLGRVIAVGRDNGTVSVYRAYGRIEDYEALPNADQQKDEGEDSFPASASASANLSHASISASRRSSVVSNPSRLRSPEVETPSIRIPSSSASKSVSSSGREPSPLLSTFSHVDRSSITARSTISAASVSSTVAANVQLDEGMPAGSLQSNVTATGHTAGRVYSEQAENRLEQQMAAAERNDHQHGVVGGVIERLGLSSHSPSPHQHSSSTHQHPRQSYHRTRSSESRRPSATSPHSPSSAEAGTQSPDQSKGQGVATTAAAAGGSSLKPSASDAWLHDPTRGSFSQVMTLFTRDRSPVVALRLVPLPPTNEDGQDASIAAPVQPTLDKAALLVVQEAGNISLWSVLEGSLIWQTDVTSAQVASFDAELSETSSKETSASLGVMQSLGRQLPAAIGTPLPRSPAGSARASPRPTFAGGDASLRRSILRSALGGSDATASSRLREAHGVKLDDSLQTLQCHGQALAAVWDSHSCAVMILDLTDGRLLLHEDVDDVDQANIPTLRNIAGSEESIELVWISEAEGKVKKQPLRVLTVGSKSTQSSIPGSSQSTKIQGIVFEEASDTDKEGSKHWTLADDHRRAQKIHLLADRILVLSSERLSILDAANGETRFAQEATSADQFKKLLGSSRDGYHLVVQTSAGLGKLDLVTEKLNRVEQQNTGNVSKSSGNEPIFTLVAVDSSARLYLGWNVPGSGALLDKVFLLQPTSSEDAGAKLQRQRQPTVELATLDLSSARTEDLVLDLRSSPAPDADARRRDSQEQAATDDRVTALLPLSLERIAVAISGGINILSLSSIAAGRSLPASTAMNTLGADHEICLVRSAVAPRSGQRLIIGGTLQGDVGFWRASTNPGQASGSSAVPHLEAALSVSTTPIEALVVFGDDDNTIRLHGCVACICADSSVTIVLLEGFRPLYTVPGRGARLTSLAVCADELLLTYDDDKARVWDLRSQELRRSIATYQAQALVEDGKGWWTVKTIEPYSPLHSGTTGVLSQLAAARDDAAAALLVDLRRAIEAAARSVRGGGAQSAAIDATAQQAHASTQTTSATGRATVGSLAPPATLRSEQDMDGNSTTAFVSIGSPAARKAVNIIRPLLPTVFPIGLESNMDAKLAALLDLEDETKGKSSFSVGLHSAPDAFMVGDAATKADAKQAWKLSSKLTTTRLLSASALLRVLGNVSELRGITEELQQFVEDEALLSSLVGMGFRGVTLTELVSYWLDSNLELQHASRSMFHAALARLDEKQLEEICNRWQGLLSSTKSAKQISEPQVELKAAPSVTAEGDVRNKALALLGSIAVKRYTSLSPRVLKDVASTIHSAITADKSNETRRSQELQLLAVAIELCRSGFSMWQHYFDATEVVRSLFALSTSTASGRSSGEGELRSLARSATLQIAAENTPLFMTTLSLDILHARSASDCAATMRLVAFMVRKRPCLLVANLPRLAEAVVKSLDPTHTTMREAVVNAATVMISELVSTYPSINFFNPTQRLAVGTHEGAVIMYDLKTATRLYVLEGHRRRTDAVSFSPDGRRLVTMSLEEGRVLVWKTTCGFSSFFSPGQMPRQGATDVKATDGAYKAFLFNVGEQRGMKGWQSEQVGEVGMAKGQGQGQGEEEEFVGFDKIGFQWNLERSVRVQIGEAQLNISVD